nr:glycosyltransferase [Massilistercora timonensis]
MEKRCIYHVPYPIVDSAETASAIRPQKMLAAFKEVFDEVFVISGYGMERRECFKKLSEKVENGINYEFMYSENSTMPNLLTEKNHVPRYPLLEKKIFQFCKRNGIPIGLFYRDIYWKFPIYKKNVHFLKRCISIPLYKYDLDIYNKYVDVLFLPSHIMNKYVGFKGRVEALPPGGSGGVNIPFKRHTEQEKIELFYVGGVGGDYDVFKLLQAMKQCEFANLTLCCHQDQWNKWHSVYNITIPENVNIIHKAGSELEEYYRKADVGVLFFEPSGYREMAMPVKLFEYLSHGLPVLSTKGSAAGEFVANNAVGWDIDYTEESFVYLIKKLYYNKNCLLNMQNRVLAVATKNTWNSRVQFVDRIMSDLKGKV